MGTKAERRAARIRVDAYHHAQLQALLRHVTDAVERYGSGEIDTYALDETIHHYHRANQELWKFCFAGGGGSHTEMIARLLDDIDADGETIDWWDRIRPRQRR